MSIFNSTDKIYHLLLMKEIHTLGGLSDEQYADLIKTLWGIDIPQHKKKAEAEDKLYIRIYADDEPSVKAEKLYQICDETQNKEVAEWLKEYFPSIEAVQGEWGHMMAYGKDGSHWCEYECSHCGEVVMRPYNYCPNCGTRMYKGGDDNETD